MPTLPHLLGDLTAIGALAVLLGTAYVHPSARREVLVSVLAAGAVAATGLLGGHALAASVADLLPVVLFLVTILVVADVCARAGLFAAGARLAGAASGGRPDRLLLGVFALAALVTAVLSLDATVVLLTPVVVGAAATLGTSSRPTSFACLRMANSASLLFPVSNLTNLLALPALGLTFAGFAARMAPVLVVVLVAEYVLLRVLFRADLRSTASPARAAQRVPVPWFPLLVVLAMLAGFAALSPLGIAPGWVSAAAAAALVWWGRATGLLGLGDAVRAAHPSFAVFVLALGVVVAAISTGFLADAAGSLLPSATTFLDLLVIAVVATAAANLLTNLSATLLLVPLLAPLGTTAVLAALLGLNIGSGLTYTGSLANLLWRRGLVRHGDPVGLAQFHRVSLLATPVTLFLAVATLSLTS